jgi:zinc protease
MTRGRGLEGRVLTVLLSLVVVILGSRVVGGETRVVGAETPVVRRVLPNGMRVLVREDHGSAIVAITLQVSGGTRLETVDTSGIANFLHRVMLRGTKRRSAAQLQEAADDLGGVLDAAGDVDHADISGQALSRHADALLDLVAEVALEPAFPREEIERERRLILSQLRTRDDTPFTLAMDTLLADLYGTHPYAQPALGRRDSIERITREALETYYRMIYRPERFVLAVSGDVKTAAILARVERLFGKLAGGLVVTDPAVSVPQPTASRRAITRAAQQAQVVVGFLGPALLDESYAAVKVLAAVLGGGMSGRLFMELRDREGLAYALGVQAPTRIGPSSFVCYLGTAPGNVEAAEAGVLREIDRIRTTPPTDDEVARAKAYILGNLAMDRRTNARQAWYLAFFELAGAGWDFPDRYRSAIDAVTTAEVAAAARRYLVQPTTVVLRPPR